MKLETDRAWKDALALLSRNRGLLAILAGVFMFLPLVALTIAIEGSVVGQALQSAKTMAAMSAAAQAFYAEFWWAMLALGVAQVIGTLAMLALLKQRGRPTVGEALGIGLRGLLPYLGAQLILSAGLVLTTGLLVAIGAATGVGAVAVITAGAAVTLAVYALSRSALVGPVMAIEGVRNPVAALARSWALTRANAGRLLVFFLLIFAAFTIVSMVATMLISLVFALFGEGVALFGVAAGSSAMSAALTTLIVAVLASVHAQLARGKLSEEPETPVI